MADIDALRPLGNWLSFVQARLDQGEILHPCELAAFTAGKEWIAFVSGEPYRTVKP